MIIGRESLKKIVEWHVLCTHPAVNMPTRFIPLVIGPSGCGKTYSIQKAIRESEQDILLIEIDATTLSPEGWKGLSLAEAIGSKWDGTDEGLEKLQKAIVYIDEFDKLSIGGGENQTGFSKLTQSSLLKWLDKDSESCYITVSNGIRETKLPIDNSKMTFIFSGAFEGLTNKQRGSTGYKKADQIGFVRDEDLDKKDSTFVDWEQVISLGIMPEIINRINILVEILPYTEEQLSEIVKNDPNYIFSVLLGTDIDKKELAKECIKNNFGARGIAKYCFQEALKQSLEE